MKIPKFIAKIADFFADKKTASPADLVDVQHGIIEALHSHLRTLGHKVDTVRVPGHTLAQDGWRYATAWGDFEVGRGLDPAGANVLPAVRYPVADVSPPMEPSKPCTCGSAHPDPVIAAKLDEVAYSIMGLTTPAPQANASATASGTVLEFPRG